MRRRTVSAAAAVAVCALVIPGVADAVVATITTPFDAKASPSCPGTAALPCTVISRTTAYQVEVGNSYQPMRVTTNGRIVGWQITLSSPSTSETHYFDTNEGGPAEAAVAILHPVAGGLRYRLDAITATVHLEPYFGQTVTFPLTTTIPVAPGDVIALSVPTWAPALELRAGRRTAWRASRPKTQCTNVVATTVQSTPGSVTQYACIYQTALVHFGAIEISTP